MSELNELINRFLKDTEAVVPVRNPSFNRTERKNSGQKVKDKPAKANDEEFSGLEGWKARGFTYTLNGGEWQDVSMRIPAEGALGILRLCLPAQSGPVEIDWIELQGDGAKKRWDF